MVRLVKDLVCAWTKTNFSLPGSRARPQWKVLHGGDSSLKLGAAIYGFVNTSFCRFHSVDQQYAMSLDSVNLSNEHIGTHSIVRSTLDHFIIVVRHSKLDSAALVALAQYWRVAWIGDSGSYL